MSKKPKPKGALKHGTYAQEVILPGEDRADYTRMLVELYDEWAPEGRTERELVDRLACFYWRRQRLHAYQQAQLQKRVDAIKLRNDRSRSLVFVKALAPQFAMAQSAEAVEDILWDNIRYRDIILGWVPRVPSQAETKWGPAIAAHLSELEVESPLDGKEALLHLIGVLPPEMDDEGKASDRLDENIDRTIKRLVQVRTSKAIFPRKDPSKLIDVSPNNDNGSTASNVKNQQKEALPGGIVEI